MDSSSFDDLLELMLSDKISHTKLKKMGLSEQDIKTYMENLLHQSSNGGYNRILADDERRVITPQAFGYLVNMLNIKSIDKETFEKVISLSMQLHLFMKRRIDKKIIDEIINYLIFSGQNEITVRDLIDFFFMEDEEDNFQDDIN